MYQYLIIHFFLLAANVSPVNINGIASGGELILNYNQESLSVPTQKGETSLDIITNIKSLLDTSTNFQFSGEVNNKFPHKFIYVENNILYQPFWISPGLFFSGTESGLNIPRPPSHVTLLYDGVSSKVSCYWQGIVSGNKLALDGIALKRTFPMEAEGKTELEFEDIYSKSLLTQKNMMISISSCNDSLVCSNMLFLFYSACSMDEFIVKDTWRNLMCNWSPWLETYETSLTAEQKVLDTLSGSQIIKIDIQDTMHPRGTMCKAYQKMLLNSKDNSNFGIYRKFLGLTPGHTYRIHARLNTFEGTPEMENWSFTMHACANAPGNNQLTTEQFTGDAPLPNNANGKQAGLIAEYGTGKAVTNSQWEHFSTAKPQCPDCIGDITLPEGADTITTWLRLEGKADLEVGFDWIKLEDLTCMSENGITPSAD